MHLLLSDHLWWGMAAKLHIFRILVLSAALVLPSFENTLARICECASFRLPWIGERSIICAKAVCFPLHALCKSPSLQFCPLCRGGALQGRCSCCQFAQTAFVRQALNQYRFWARLRWIGSDGLFVALAWCRLCLFVIHLFVYYSLSLVVAFVCSQSCAKVTMDLASSAPSVHHPHHVFHPS